MEPKTHPFVCNYPLCQSSFGTRFNLRRHIEARHLGIKKFACDICGLKLASKQTKAEHIYTHTGEKPYMCTFPGCFKQFRQSSQLYSHLKQHDYENHDQAPPLPLISEARMLEQRDIKLPIPDLLVYFKQNN